MIVAYVVIFFIGVIVGPIISIFITPVFCFFRKVFYVPLIRKKLLRQAKENNHVIKAKLIKYSDILTSNDGFGATASGERMAIYHYEYAGKKYKYRAITAGCLPEEITLYYLRNPRKATVASELGLRESHWLLYYLLISVIMVVLVFIIGVYFFVVSQ
jgi:hypothetical protein